MFCNHIYSDRNNIYCNTFKNPLTNIILFKLYEILFYLLIYEFFFETQINIIIEILIKFNQIYIHINIHFISLFN